MHVHGSCRITAELTGAIAADIRKGCFERVAGARHGVSQFTMYSWAKRGEREAAAREEAHLRADDAASEPECSPYEQFWRAMEAAKADARFVAETRVFETNPQFWLSRGYAKVDWRNADAVARLVDAAVDQRVQALLAAHDRQQQQRAADWRAQQAEVEQLQAELADRPWTPTGLAGLDTFMRANDDDDQHSPSRR